MELQNFQKVSFILVQLTITYRYCNKASKGKVTGKTVICGLTDDFPLITPLNNINLCFTLANLTLQGGSRNLLPQDYGAVYFISKHEVCSV
jgi:hypothetical protein